MNEKEKTKTKEGFKELVLAEIKISKNPLEFLEGVKGFLQASLRKFHESEFLKLYYRSQLEVVEKLIEELQQVSS